MTTLPTVRPGGYGRFARAADALLRPLRRVGAFRLSPASLLGAAARRTGLEDESPDEIAEPLALLCDDLGRRPPTGLGAVMVWASLVQALANRRLVQAEHRRRAVPPARAPIVIVGWHRTGTTLLHQLLDAVPGLGFVPLHRLMEPVRRPGARLRAVLATRFAWAVAPEMPTLHPQSIDGPEECWILLLSALRADGIALHWDVPSYARWLDTCDLAPAYRFYARSLAVLAEARGHRLVTKDAAHLLDLPALLEAVPDACLVWTHRDPVDCVGSFASLSAVHHRSMYGVYDPERAGRVCVSRMSASIARASEARPRLPGGRLLDVAYAELVADPLAVVARVCEAFGVPLDEAGRAAVARRAAALRAARPPTHRWSCAQWGLDPAEIRARFPGYDHALPGRSARAAGGYGG